LADIDKGIADYISGHRTGVLATSRKAGAAQLTLIAYHFDGTNFAISTRAPTQKAKNLRRRPEASMAIIDGQRQLIVYGNVAIVDDEAEVLRLHRERIKRIALREESDDDLKARLIREERVVLVLTPDRFYPASMPTA
jgi:PPOX class probable F420-dependent enzyme